ncbi:MAG: hypothetical protein H7X79_10855 [Sporomusaceae bacterium]|nr:hypothetical protein [Sporomusaceae bacterium]
MRKCFIIIKASIRGFLLLFCLFLVPVAVSANEHILSTPIPSLEQMEPLLSDGPEVLAALSASARDEALEALEKQRTGVKYFGGITYGYNNESTFDMNEDKNRYNKVSLTGGLNFPMLGTFQKEKIGKLETEMTTIESKHHSRVLLLNNLVALRKAYTALWIEQQKEEMTQRFLNTEAETVHILQERQAQGLVLPVDRLEFLSVYYDARRDMVASKLRQTRALNIIGLATGRKWDMTEKIKAPSLPSVDGKKININNYPDIIYQNNLVSQYEKLSVEKKRIDREGNLAIGLTGTRNFSGTTENGAYITFSMTEPAKTIGSKDQAKIAAADDLNRAKKEEISIRLKLEGQVEEALAMSAYAAADVNARQARLIVMAESIREKMLRRMVLPGDTFEQLQHSKSQYYRTALEMLDHEEIYLQSAIDIIRYVYPTGLTFESMERVFPINENDAMRKTLLAPNWLHSENIQDDMILPLDFSNMLNLKLPIVPFGSIVKVPALSSEKKTIMPFGKLEAAVYVWNAESFLQRDTRTAALNEIIHAGFSRMLISFTPKQIFDLSSPEGKDELDSLIVMAKSKGLRIDLMLGDPTWAQKEQRGELLALITQLKRFDFDGIHLDIEPDSLPGVSARRAELLDGLADTIKMVKEITMMPVSISIHPRYLEDDLGVIARQKLLSLGLEEVVVMIYSDNPHLTAQRMSAIISSNPNVTFSLAQSVEKDIPWAESYADSNQQEFKDAMHILEDNLAIYGLKGIFIQAWENYNKGEAQ